MNKHLQKGYLVLLTLLLFGVISLGIISQEALGDVTVPGADGQGRKNLSLLPGVTANASSVLRGFEQIHQPAHLNDGLYNHDNSWISNGEPSWVEINLGRVFDVEKVVLGSEHEPQFHDRAITAFNILVAIIYNVDSKAPTWKKVFSYNDSQRPIRRTTVFKFAPVKAKWVRIEILEGVQWEVRIDELEIYESIQPANVPAISRPPREPNLGITSGDTLSLVNAGFETGGFAGWTLTVPPGGSGEVVTSHSGDLGTTYNPVEGNYLARLKTDGPGSYTTLTQSFNISAGMLVDGWAAFDAIDYMPYNDNASVRILDFTGTNVIATPWYSDVATVGNYGDGPWTYWSWTAPADGTYTLEYRIANAGDDVVDSYALFDASGGIPGEDITPPETIINFGPTEEEHLTVTTVTFEWAGSDNVTNPGDLLFAYRLDAEPFSEFSPETSHTYIDLPEGMHTFEVRAKDEAGNIDPTPATRNFGIDLTPPETLFISGPPDSGWANTTSVTFWWWGIDNVSMEWELLYSYELDGGGFTPFGLETSHTFDSLSEGEHTFAVKAMDKAGWEDPTPLTINFTVDVTPPDTTITSGPTEGELIGSSEVTFEWTGSDDRTPVGQLQYAYEIDANPFGFSSDTSGTFLLSDGVHTFSVKAIDLATNEDATPATRSFEIDTPPTTTITSGPAENEHISVTTATFEWTGTDVRTAESNLLFSYRLDSEPFSEFSPETSHTYTDLPEGMHTFEVRAKDEAGNIDPTPDIRNFGVDLTPPDTLLISGPLDGGWANTTSVPFEWTGIDNVSEVWELLYSYELDGGGFTPFGSDTSHTFDNLTEGEHAFVVTAKDKAGWEDPTPLTITFTVDVTLPDTTITSGPAEGELIADSSVTFEWTGSDDRTPVEQLQYAYEIDANPFGFGSDTSGTFLLSDGVHTFSVKASDLATNEDATPATRSFEIDATPPTTTITAGPAENEHLQVTTATFEWTGTDNRTAESDLLFSYRLDSNPYSDFSSDTTHTLTNLSEGLHTFEVRAKDEAGNIETTAIRHFAVDLTPPDTRLTSGPQDGAIVNTASVTFVWTGTDNLSAVEDLQFAYKLDGGDFTSFSADTSHTFNNLTEGAHTFMVKAKDKAGHEDPTPLTINFTVALVDLQPTAVSGPSDAWSGNSIAVAWTVINNGIGAISGSWKDEVYLSDDPLPGSDALLGEFTHTGDLAGGASYNNTQTVTLPNGISGDYWIIVETDSLNNVYEENAEGNNILVDDAAIHVNLTPPPDLQVTNVTPSGDAWSGRQIYVDWTVINNGPGNAPGSWEDRVYLSTDDQVGNDTLLGTFRYDNDLNVGESYTFSRPVTLPGGISGNRWIIVATDWANVVYEHDAENNNSRVSDAPILVQMIPYPDLKVTAVNIPGEAFAGLSLSVSWTVTNSGTGATDAPFWYDAAYLSLDTSYDDSDTYLGQVTNASYLEPGESYVQTAQFTLPREIAGPFYLLVQTNSSHHVQEYNVAGDAESNNWGSSATQVQVQLPPTADLQVTRIDAPQTGRSGQGISVTWDVSNKGDARTEDSTWSDTLYLSQDTQLSTQNDVLLGTFEHQGALDADVFYTRAESVTLPIDRWGQYYIFVLTDSGDQIYEQLWENNNSAYDSEPIDIILSPPADLEITSISAPAVGSAGNPLTIDWTVANNGGGPTNVESWNDSVYLSANETLETGSDTLLGSFSHSGILEAGVNYSESRSLTLPKAIQGVYYLIVWTDSGNAVFEYEWENNNTRSTSSIQIKVANLTVSSINAPVNVYPVVPFPSTGLFLTLAMAQPMLMPGKIEFISQRTKP